MSYNRFANVSIENALPCKEVEGTYNRFEEVSESNPLPVMVVDEDAYTPFGDVSETNPQPIALDTGATYTRFQDLSDTNRLPVVIVEGQSYNHRHEISMTNPLPVIDTTAEGGGPYVAGAVHFNGGTYLSTESLTSTDGDYISMSCWIKMSLADRSVNPSIAVLDPTNNLGFNFSWYADPQPLRLDLNNSDGNNTYRLFTSDAPDDQWFHLLISAYTNAAQGDKIAKIYINDVDVTDTHDIVGPTTPTLNGFEFRVGSDGLGTNIIGDIADLRIMPNTSLLVAGDIPEAKRRLFIDENGKPVDPAVATAELGAPCILFSGDAASFANNQGYGGAFTPSPTGIILQLSVDSGGASYAAGDVGSVDGGNADAQYTVSLVTTLDYAPIIAVDVGAKKFVIAGDHRLNFPATGTFVVSDSTGNDGTYTIVSASLNGGDTEIVVDEAIADATADGAITSPYGPVVSVSIAQGGTGYSAASGVATVPGAGFGSGLTLNITSVSGFTDAATSPSD